MSRNVVIIKPPSFTCTVYILYAISTPPFYELVVEKRGLKLSPLFQYMHQNGLLLKGRSRWFSQWPYGL